MAKLFPFSLVKNYYQQMRFIPRWNHRRPVQVLPPDYDEENDTDHHEMEPKPQQNVIWKHPLVKEEKPKLKVSNKIKPLSISSKKKEPIVTDMLETTIDPDGNFVYTKMKNRDIRVGNLLTSLKTSRQKFFPETILLEGKRIIKDALVAGCKLDYLIFSRQNEVDYLKQYLPKFGAKLFKMPYKEMQLWSDLTTNPGIMGIFKTPKIETYNDENSLPLTVICDNVRDPNNLGPILRACSGVGCHRLVLTKGCVNIWDNKVLRASSGAHFKLQVHHRQDWPAIRNLIGNNVNVFVADNKFERDNKSLLNTIPLLPYYGVNFNTNQHKVIVIGGETEGISPECYELLKEFQGVRINVPLNNNIDSLNSGMALGIIIFEIKRQLSQIVE